ncbi:hypothetical protein FQR52_12450 [Listeria monocytogenes]|nr:hypothetical protein [Listeria monocytogenes]
MEQLDYSVLTDKDLTEIISGASNELFSRKRELEFIAQEARIKMRAAGVYHFQFKATANASKKPYVARLIWDKVTMKVGHKFWNDFVKTSDGSYTTVCGVFDAAEEDIFEIRKEGTHIYMTHKGELMQLCAKNDHKKTAIVHSFLAGFFDASTMLSYLDDESGEVKIINDLID